MPINEWGVARARPVSFASERLIAQIKRLAYDAEGLLRATAGQTGEHIAAARAHMEASLRRAREDAAAASEQMVRATHAATRAANRYVRANPWQAVGIAAGLGFVLGRMSVRR